MALPRVPAWLSPIDLYQVGSLTLDAAGKGKETVLHTFTGKADGANPAAQPLMEATPPTVWPKADNRRVAERFSK